MTRVRVLYTDVDGTLVGPLGNLFWDDAREYTLEPARAIVSAHRSGLELVPLSGRSRSSIAELARLVGAPSWIAELGAVRAYDHGREIVFDQGEYPGSGHAADELRKAGALLAERFPGRLEEHAPWNEQRETSFMVRGAVDVEEVDALLTKHGFDWAECLDNGVIPRRFETLPHVEHVRVYHLTPRGVSKRAGVAADREHRSLDPDECAVIGDARSDLECAPEVGRTFVVANALGKDPTIADLVATTPGAEVTARPYGLGFADTVAALLA